MEDGVRLPVSGNRNERLLQTSHNRTGDQAWQWHWQWQWQASISQTSRCHAQASRTRTT
jgi:hypothetical protein